MLIRLTNPLLLLLLLLLLIAPLSARAALVLQGSRVIYEEDHGETSVQMRYTGSGPTLLQIWLSRDDANTLPGAEEVPFMILPSVTRLDPGNGQSVRILRTGEGLPQDRETLFYFNTLEVPPRPTEQIAAGEPYMQISIRGRFKFFYRPKGLPINPKQAWDQLQFSFAQPLRDGRLQVRIQNGSPYHLTFANLAVRRAELADTPTLLRFNHQVPSVRMVAPFSDLLMPLEWDALPAGAALPSNLEVDYTIINDAGGSQSRQQRIGG